MAGDFFLNFKMDFLISNSDNGFNIKSKKPFFIASYALSFEEEIAIKTGK